MKDAVRMEEQDKRLEWEAPTVTEWDVVAETQNATSTPGISDGVTYS